MTFNEDEIANIMKRHVVERLKVPRQRLVTTSWTATPTGGGKGKLSYVVQIDTDGSGSPYRDEGPVA